MTGKLESILLAILLMSTGCAVSIAQISVAVSSSENYQVVEPEFGVGASLDSCSGSYCAKATIGSLTGDEASSQNYTSSFGPVATGGEPMLDVLVEPGISQLGELATTKTSFKTMTVKVRSYQSGGYMLQIYGDPPSYQDHSLATTSSPVVSTAGVEQFGINIVANTQPESFGANPIHQPSNEDASSLAEDNYKTPDRFMYQCGDVLAITRSQSSEVHYTISMVVNVAGSTPAGHYSGDYSTIITPVF